MLYDVALCGLCISITNPSGLYDGPDTLLTIFFLRGAYTLLTIFFSGEHTPIATTTIIFGQTKKILSLDWYLFTPGSRWSFLSDKQLVKGS